MRHIIYLAFLIASLISKAQTQYEERMVQALVFMETSQFNQSEQLLERIASVESDLWLPHYYIAQINSLKSWNETDESVLKAQLSKAQNHLDLGLKIEPENVELLIMQAQILTNWVAFDGMTYGMKYGARISALYSRALELEPSNPRANFCKAEWDMGSARYFGKDTAPFCQGIKTAIELFANFKTDSPMDPNWGLERAKQALKTCHQ